MYPAVEKTNISPTISAPTVAELRRGEAEILLHGKRGKTNIRTVEAVDHEGEDEERHEAPAGLAHGTGER